MALSADNIMFCWEISFTYTPDAGNLAYPPKTAKMHFRASNTVVNAKTPQQRVLDMAMTQVGSKMLSITGMSPSVSYGTAVMTTDQSWSTT